MCEGLRPNLFNLTVPRSVYKKVLTPSGPARYRMRQRKPNYHLVIRSINESFSSTIQSSTFLFLLSVF